MEITTACLDLDGINIMGHGKVTIKRPNDYNPAWAPPVNPSTLPRLDTAKLGIVSSTVPDGPNKIFIGGLPYHLTESQVLELLGAFGTVKAFHLVKADATALTSKGYCFVEYADPNLTQVACMGLNGMDMGGGKQLSCRMAVQGQDSSDNSGSATMQTGGGAFAAPVAAPPAAATMVDGVDVDALLNAALGGWRRSCCSNNAGCNSSGRSHDADEFRAHDATTTNCRGSNASGKFVGCCIRRCLCSSWGSNGRSPSCSACLCYSTSHSRARFTQHGNG